ncbi:MAG: hypothetical protein MJ231_02130, partial [bacterium]|nr:hypothetical protein [bacterium]
MKKVLLFSLIFLFSAIAVYAYETIIIKFPQDEVWDKAYYKKVGLEAIVQYVPRGQTHNNWQRAVVVHSYNHSTYPVRVFMTNSLARMEKANPTGKQVHVPGKLSY